MVLRFAVFFLGLAFVTVACERIPEWEQKKISSKSQEIDARLSEWSKWLWTCRATSFRSQADQEIEKFRDYFRSKNLSSVDTAGPKSIMGPALLWNGKGYLLTLLPGGEGLREIECRNLTEAWLPAKIVGIDHSLDYAVLKVNLPRSHSGENPWLNRNEDLHLDENFQILSSSIPGQIDRLNVNLQTLSPHLNTGIDSELQLFLPPPPPLLSNGFMVDEKLRIVGFLLPASAQAWGAAVSVRKMKETVTAILSGNPLKRAYLGMKLRIDPVDGFVVQQVQVGSPAYQAGLRPLDRLVEWDGVKLESTTEWKEISPADIGRSIQFTFKRGSSLTDATMKVSTQD